MTWGYHLVLDGFDCDPGAIRDQFVIQAFSEKVVKDIDMTPFGGPLIIKFGSGEAQGYTLCQLIETSNITAHFAEETNAMYLDVFSCKEYDPAIVENLVKEFFKPKKVKKKFLKR